MLSPPSRPRARWPALAMSGWRNLARWFSKHRAPSPRRWAPVRAAADGRDELAGRHCINREGPMTSLFDLAGRIAVVTGSSRGIGRAIAGRLAQHGAHVVISSRKAEACVETAEAINAACGREAAIAIDANISSKDALRHLVE